MTATLKTVAIKASNSLDFLKHAFHLYESGAPFTVQRAGLDLSHYPGLEITERLATSPGGSWGQHAFTPGMSDAPAQILFSSGTEGRPKPIVLSQRNISDVVTRLNAAMEPDESIREYIGLVFGWIAIGHWYSRQEDLHAAQQGAGSRWCLRNGVVDDCRGGPAAALSLCDRHSPLFQSLVGYVFYFFTTVFLVGIFELTLKQWSRIGRTGRFVSQVLIVIGGLALPIYAFHGIAIPLKEILLISSLPGAIAMILPIGAFFAVMIYLGWRLRRMYFG